MDTQITYDIELKFETKHDWEEVKGILEEWEEGAIEGYDGADSAFSMKAYKSETYVNK